MREEEFTRELASLLNRASAENGSNTPDFVLADYLRTCLRALDEAINARSKWYGRQDSPGSGAALTPPGHVLVGPDARETVARAVWEFNRACEWTEATEEEKTDYLLVADAVLRALGVRGGA